MGRLSVSDIFIISAFVSGSLFPLSSFTQPISNNYKSDSTYVRLNIERAMIYVPEYDWMYSHHPSIVHFNNRFIATWSNGHKDEDASGQRVVYSISSDFIHWTKPRVLAEPSIGSSKKPNVLTAAGFHKYHNTLAAYYGEYSTDRKHTHLWAKTSVDGEHWSAPIDMHVPVNPNHGPQAVRNGRLIICGNFTFPYTDDPTGISGWRMSSFYPDSLYTEDNPAAFYSPAEKEGLPPLCEASFFQTGDDKLHALLRVTGDGWKGRLWLTESMDNGAHWSKPRETPFTDNDSKFQFGRLPDNRFYYVGIPDTLHHYERSPLVIALSDDGKNFDRQFIIADQPYKLKKDGLYKGGQYGYPVTVIYNGYMYVIVSRQKESIELIRFSLNQLEN